MKLWTEVRLDVRTGKLSMRQACKKYKLNFRTIQKILNHEETPGYRKTGKRSKPVLGPFVPIIHEILEADKTKPKKQRHTAKRIFERLREEYHYPGGISVVQDEVRRWKQGQAEVFMPLSHPPGQAQFDFGEAQVIYRGRKAKAMFCVMSLPNSDVFLVQAFPRECTESFQEGHRRAFEFFGGVPTRISYDNSKIAVAKIVGRRGDRPTREFLRLKSHHLYEHHFCQVRRPNEKGHTENMVKYARSNFMVPVPEFDDYETFNQKLVDDCRNDLQRQLRGKAGTKAELLEEDRQAMQPLPLQCFEACRKSEGKHAVAGPLRSERLLGPDRTRAPQRHRGWLDRSGSDCR